MQDIDIWYGFIDYARVNHMYNSSISILYQLNFLVLFEVHDVFYIYCISISSNPSVPIGTILYNTISFLYILSFIICIMNSWMLSAVTHGIGLNGS
jgi:hypothetical protein